MKYTGGRLPCDPALEARASGSFFIHLGAAFSSLVVLACATAPLYAQNPVDTARPPVRDSIRPIDTTIARPRIGIRVKRDSIAVLLPTVLSSAQRDSYRKAVQQIEAARATAFQQNMRSLVQAVWGQVAASSFATAEKPPAFATEPDDKSQRKVAAKAGDIIAQHSDLSLQLNARMELRAERNLNERCAVSGFAQPAFACQSSFVPLTDFQFNVRSGGVVAERVHVDVDYDTQREFDASNNISVTYDGKGKELLQRVELGNVTFQPPPSRFITAGIPSGNYGLQAIAKLGSARIRGIVAQQKGNVINDRVFTVGDRTLSAIDRRIEDHQFEARRFFFTVSPRLLGGYPNIDLLDSRRMEQLASQLPDTLRPTRVFLYRLLIGGQPANPSGPQFRILGDPRSRRGPVYERLREGIDYYVDPSQLWIALVRPLSLNNERLVVAYRVRINGRDTVHVTTGGTPDLEYRSQTEQFANLLWDPQVTPDDPAFEREVRSVYRIGGPEVERQSVVVKIVTGTSDDQEKAVQSNGDSANTYLQLFGLAQRTNTSTFDIENRLWPRPSDPNFELSLGSSATKVIRDQFLVFPSLRPFAKNGLARGANPSNDTIYTTPSEYVKSAQRPQSVYHIRVRYQAQGSGEAGSLMLGAIQVRPNSERLFVDGIPLVRGTDYTVDYDLGQVTFARPDTLFPHPRQVSVQFEENPVFAETPTSIFGATAEFPLDNGTVAFTAISQTQNSTYNRPPLGFEPAASLMAGVTAQMSFDASPLTSLVSKLPYGETSAPSRVNVSGEFAASRPKPNSAGQAFIESFEGEGGIQVPLDETGWYYSSQPALGRQIPARLGTDVLDLTRAATMAWQSDGVDARNSAVRVRIEDIDPLTNIIGTGLSAPEPLLWMTLYPLSVGGLHGQGSFFRWTVANTPTGRRWRSIRTALGPSGSDLSRIENIEFWAQIPVTAARRSKNPMLVMDFGDISENSVAFAPDTLRVTLGGAAPAARDTSYTGKQLEGFDRLDSERDPFSRAFNVGVNDNGLAGDVAGAINVVADTIPGSAPIVSVLGNFATCRGGYSLIRILGDATTDCTVGNNRLDEEDIDGDNVLNLTSAERDAEQVRRYIVNLADSSGYTRVGKCATSPRTIVGPAPEERCWVLFRIPFRNADDSIGAPLLRRIRALRITMISGVGAADLDFTQVPIARLRLTGAPWLKRSAATLRGIGAETNSIGFVNAGVIGTQDRNLANGLSYESPPGVVDEPDTKRSQFQTNRVQINERSLRLTAGDLQQYDRAEAYFRFPEGEKNFMAYKELRLWARGVRAGWGGQGDLQFFVKIGRDPNNFYMYRTALNDGTDRTAWLPEVKVDFQKLFELRGDIQNAYLKGQVNNSCTGIDSVLIARTPMPSTGVRYVACSDGYVAYSADPGINPPNLAGVQELAVGIVRTGNNATFTPGDTLEVWVDDIRLGGVVNTAGFAGQLSVSVLASDFADIRMNVTRRDPHFRQLAEQPTFLTDNSFNLSSAFHLEKLLPRGFGWSVPVSVNYASSSSDPLFISRTDVEGDIVDGLRTPKSSATSVTFAVARATPLTDSKLAPLLNNLSLAGTYTSGMARSEYENGHASNLTVGLDYNLSRALLPELSKWAPAELHVTSVYQRGSDDRLTFLKPAEALDDIPRRIAGLTSTWRNGTSLQLRPSGSLSGRLDFNSVRDLRGYGNDTELGIITGSDRVRLFGADAGLEREREMQAGLNYAPTFSQWFKPRLDFGSSYNMLRDPNTLSFLRLEDSTGAVKLPRRLGSSQTSTAGVTLDLPRLAKLHVDSTRVFYRLLNALQPVDVNFNRSIISVFDQSASGAPISYQLAFGGIGRFREIGDTPATSAGLINQLSANHTIALPLGMSLANRYQLISGRNWTRRADNTQAVTDGTQVVFPDLSLRWSMKPDRLRRVVSSIGGTARAVQTRQMNARQPDRLNIPAGVESPDALSELDATFATDRAVTLVRSYPATLALVFAGARPLSANAGYAFAQRRETRAGLSAKSGTRDMSFEIAKPWAVPPDWKLKSDVRTRLSYENTHGDNFVLNPLAVSRESRLTDNGRRAFSFSADTDVAENLSSSFVFSRVVSFDKNLNRQFTQTVLSAVLHLQFFGGDLK